jgi:hypothetical protein
VGSTISIPSISRLRRGSYTELDAGRGG